MFEGALDGVAVVDLTHHVAGPYCTKLLADYGATVIKVEPPGGEPARRRPPFLHDTPHPEGSGLFAYLNTNKLSVTLDLATEDGRALLRRLVRRADIVVENFEPRVLPGWGLTHAALAAERPGLVLTSISNFGQTGPYRDLPASELTLFAMGGKMFAYGYRPRPPLRYADGFAEYFAGATAAAATVGAYLGVQMGQPGRHVDISVLECLLGSAERDLMFYGYSGESPRRREGPAPMQVYPALDGDLNVTQNYGWEPTARLLGRPDLADDPRFTTHEARAAHTDEVDALLIPWTMQRTRAQAFRELQAGRVIGGPILTTAEVVADEAYRARGYFVAGDHPYLGHTGYPGAPFRMSETPWRLRRPAPMLGQHTAEVLGQRLGLTDDDITALRGRRIIA